MMYETLSTKEYRKHKKTSPVNEEKNAAVWLDHKHALILILQGGSIVQRIEIASELPRKRRSSGGTKAKEPYKQYSLHSEHTEHKWRDEHTREYFLRVLQELTGIHRAVAMGPGEMKREFLKTAQKDHHFSTVFDPDPLTLHPLSRNQLAQVALDYFAPPKN